MPTYGGDEVNALVLDVGSTWTRAGFAGEDLPRALFPSQVGYIESEKSEESEEAAAADVEMGDDSSAAEKPRKRTQRAYFVGDTESSTWRSGMEIGGPLTDGLVSDWDAYEKIWEYAFKTRQHVRTSEHPVLVSEAAWSTSAQRAKLAELAFERFDAPAFYVCKTPVLSAFGAGKHTALVVDVGGETASASAVYEGFCLQKSVVRQAAGGELVSEQILARLRDEYQYEPTPLFDIRSRAPVETQQPPAVVRHGRAGTTASFAAAMRLRAVHEFKDAVCECLERPYDAALVRSKPLKPFEFPDGFNVAAGALRFAAPEALFDPARFVVRRPPRLEGAALLGVHEMAVRSVLGCDVDLRPQLLASVVLAGGSTLFPGFAERLAAMLQDACPGSRIKFAPLASKAERRATAWLGGSILASLGTFHQLWVSRAEYEEHGAGIVDKKCQ
ncbi:NuA4 histone acetyltransferase subunit [Coemansia sp. RSA 2424]|nr:NuA4 histone acetyltransferase subunit [Coemansia sp. RSA 2424]